jgi:hypothetical protein
MHVGIGVAKPSIHLYVYSGVCTCFPSRAELSARKDGSNTKGTLAHTCSAMTTSMADHNS